MDLIKLIQDLNKSGSDVYSGLNAAYNTLDKAAGGLLPYGVKGDPPSFKPKEKTRKAGEVFQRDNPVTKYFGDVPDKGLFPVISINPTHESLLTAAKYAAGPLGKPIRILRSPETSEKLQEQIDGASVRGGKLYHGLGEPNYEKTRFPSNINGAGIVGQFIGNPQLNNDVTVSEPYDTKGLDWHKKQYEKHMRNKDIINAAESIGNMGFKSLENIGWANMYPRGKEQTIGKLKPGHVLYKNQSFFFRPAIEITVIIFPSNAQLPSAATFNL